MVKDYLAISNTYVVDVKHNFWDELNEHVQKLANSGYKLAITNSIFSGNILETLIASRIRCLSLVHELPRIINNGFGAEHIKKIFGLSDIVVFPNNFVKRALTKVFDEPTKRSVVRPQGMYKNLVFDTPAKLREKLGIPKSSKIVINVGYADLRKGVDLFIQVARFSWTQRDDLHFVWLGGRDADVKAWLASDSPNMHFLEFTNDVGAVLSESDIFLLTSREDPFPSVVLEALSFGLPVVGFEEAGGASELLANPNLGRVVPLGDVAAAFDAVVTLLEDPGSDHKESGRSFRADFIHRNFDFGDYCADLLKLIGGYCRVSVIVPNYNYGQYIEQRLASIFSQTYPLFEVIVLDDASNDASVAIIESCSKSLNRDFILVENEANSGNVFSQWKRGVDLAKGDFVWIAEADDLSDPMFLDRLIKGITQVDALFGFSDSRAIDAQGDLVYESYKGYYSTAYPEALSTTQAIDSRDFLSEFLAVQNYLLNVSSVVWKRSVLQDVFGRLSDAEVQDLTLAGDWKIYVLACLIEGTIFYDSTTLNVHRRHSGSVTGRIDPAKHVDEIETMHHFINSVAVGGQFKSRQQDYVRKVRAQLVH
ncbi:glycosyltransferase [Methylobacterium komagatae]|uniref:Glycosyltransferase n=1 Tax=Methylobacterium komagatae TaxID=374425 RepID=A0ABW2BNY9_9HYPH